MCVPALRAVAMESYYYLDSGGGTDAMAESLRSVEPAKFCVEAIMVIGQSTPEIAQYCL